MPDREGPAKGWAIADPAGNILVSNVRITRRDVIRDFLGEYEHVTDFRWRTWDYWKERGWRAAKVEIRAIDEARKS